MAWTYWGYWEPSTLQYMVRFHKIPQNKCCKSSWIWHLTPQRKRQHVTCTLSITVTPSVITLHPSKVLVCLVGRHCSSWCSAASRVEPNRSVFFALVWLPPSTTLLKWVPSTWPEIPVVVYNNLYWRLDLAGENIHGLKNNCERWKDSCELVNCPDGINVRSALSSVI